MNYKGKGMKKGPKTIRSKMNPRIKSKMRKKKK